MSNLPKQLEFEQLKIDSQYRYRLGKKLEEQKHQSKNIGRLAEILIEVFFENAGVEYAKSKENDKHDFSFYIGRQTVRVQVKGTLGLKTGRNVFSLETDYREDDWDIIVYVKINDRNKNIPSAILVWQTWQDYIEDNRHKRLNKPYPSDKAMREDARLYTWQRAYEKIKKGLGETNV